MVGLTINFGDIMASFLGMAKYTVDSKGRINIPAKMKKLMTPEANNTVVITRGIEKCIIIYPLDVWNELEKEFRKLNYFTNETRMFQRIWFMHASLQELDSQSRIVVPKELLEYSGIKSEVVIVGLLDKMEIWEPAEYNSYMDVSPEEYSNVVRKVMAKNESPL
jgi:MraZ protein